MFEENPDTVFDPAPSELIVSPEFDAKRGKRIAVIRTSDRNSFRRCRRAWGWSSHLKGNLGGTQAISPLWLGSGFHFALEDLHGHNRYGTSPNAFKAYLQATGRKSALPATWREDSELAIGMLEYYENDWLQNRDHFQTHVHQGQAQVEVNFRILVPFDAEEWGYDEVVYSGTLDRVIIDEHGILWIVEYKTAKRIVTGHYDTDGQVSAYCWAASVLYPDYPIGGVWYQQHLKQIPEPARMLASGRLSTDKRQSTTYHNYRRAILTIYGEINRAPADIVDTLNAFCKEEEPERNSFIRRDKIRRNAHQQEAEGNKVLMEVGDMLNPLLDLYPNPTRDCGWCNFQGPCVSLDDGSDWEYELKQLYRPRETVYDSWRQYLPAPEELTNG
jgi:hypothetical protein